MTRSRAYQRSTDPSNPRTKSPLPIPRRSLMGPPSMGTNQSVSTPFVMRVDSYPKDRSRAARDGETVVMRSATGTVRWIRAEHRQLEKFQLG